MGQCSSKGADASEERNAGGDLERSEEVVHKLLLLGAGESGKSTIFRQIVRLYGEGYSNEQRRGFRTVIDANIVQSMQALAKYSEILDPQFGTKVSDAAVVSKNFILALDEESKVDETISTHITTLWSDSGIRKTFEHSSLFQLPECSKYFFERVEVVGQPGYVPSFQDILNCRARTTGIQRVQFSLGSNTSKHKFAMVDVGGQRNERKKWKKTFQGVTAVLFVAALSSYDLSLFEDGKTNRMQEALHLFAEICTSHWFENKPLVLFLNKSDLFEKKIQTVDLSVCFPEYTGGLDYYAAAEFIDHKFREKAAGRKRDIFSHVTTATDTDNIQHVFEDVKDIVVKEFMESNDLMS